MDGWTDGQFMTGPVKSVFLSEVEERRTTNPSKEPPHLNWDSLTLAKVG